MAEYLSAPGEDRPPSPAGSRRSVGSMSTLKTPGRPAGSPQSRGRGSQYLHFCDFSRNTTVFATKLLLY